MNEECRPERSRAASKDLYGNLPGCAVNWQRSGPCLRPLLLVVRLVQTDSLQGGRAQSKFRSHWEAEGRVQPAWNPWLCLFGKLLRVVVAGASRLVFSQVLSHAAGGPWAKPCTFLASVSSAIK
jgi:hypothetical protein